MIYKCPVCGSSVPSWIAKEEHFECPDCEASLTSNIQKTLRQSLFAALVSWLTILILLQQYSGSWGYAAAVSIEGGGMLSAALAALYYHLAVKIELK